MITPTKECDHVNFKSLLTFFDITRSDLVNYRLNIEEMTEILKKHKKFTKSVAFTMASLYQGRIADSEESMWEDGIKIKSSKLNELNV